MPKRIFEIRPIRWLLDKGVIVICAGGGGIPTVYDEEHNLIGADVVIDKDRASALLADEISADLLVLATDVDGVYLNWGKPDQQRIERTSPQELSSHQFSLGSMAPKVEAACDFVTKTGKTAVIGSLKELSGLLAGSAGTTIYHPV
jgi:carbamate kinase